MKYKPHDYQRFTTNFITSHPEAAIFLGMGLGKTIITLTAIKSLILDSFEVTKVLIVAPLRVARDTWPTELAKWDHLTDLRMSVMVGDKKTRTTALGKDADIYDINRENIPRLVEATCPDWPFDMGIMITYGSYLEKKEDIVQSSARIAGFDLLVSFLAGLMIVPTSFVALVDVPASDEAGRVALATVTVAPR